MKIEIELDLKTKKAIEIIAKAFSWTFEQLIIYAIKRDIEYIEEYADLDYISDLQQSDLQQYYHIEKIDMNELKKLIFLEEIC